MATLSSAGIGSGLDAESIISKLVAIERQPITRLQSQEKQLETQLSTYGKLQAALATLRDAAAKIADEDGWSPTKTSSSDAAAVTGVAGATTGPARYQVQVGKLASGQTVVGTTRHAAVTDVVGAGTLHIQLGAWNEDQTDFTAKAGAAAVDIVIAPGADSLQAVRDSINAAEAGLTASIVTDSSGSRLVLRSTTTGAQNGFQITVDDADGGHGDATGLSALAFDPGAGIASMSLTQAADSATATINGVEVVSDSNELAGVIDGLTLKLSRETTAPVEVNVTRDDEKVKESVGSFVSAYNDLVKMLKDSTRADPKSSGALAGDGTAVQFLSALRSMVGDTSGASTAFSRLSGVGIEVQSDGMLKVNAAKLDTAFAQVGELTKLFTNADAGNAANNGFAVRFKSFATQMLSLSGSLQTRSEGLKTRIRSNEDRQAALEDRVLMTEKRLRAQYTALDNAMAQLTGKQSYVTQMLNAISQASSSSD